MPHAARRVKPIFPPAMRGAEKAAVTVRRHSKRCGSSMVYVLFIVLVLGLSVVSLLNNIGNEIMVNATRNKRVKLQTVAEGALNIAHGRLRLLGDVDAAGAAQAPRVSWADPTGAAHALPAGGINLTAGGAITIDGASVTAWLEDIPGNAYDAVTNPQAQLKITAADSNGRTVTITQMLKEPTASDYSDWHGKGRDYSGGSWAGSSWVYIAPEHTGGRAFYDVSAVNNGVSDKAWFLGGLAPPYPVYHGQVTVFGASTIITDPMSLLPLFFGDGARAVPTDTTQTPYIDQNIYRTANMIAGKTVKTIVAGDNAKKFQIRLRNNGTYDWRLVADPFDTTTVFTNELLPTGDNSVLEIDYAGINTLTTVSPFLTDKLVVGGGANTDKQVILMPRTDCGNASNGSGSHPNTYYSTTSGVQVWCDSAGTWAPSSERVGIALNQANARFSGKLTIITNGNIEVVGSICYASGEAGSDSLSLIAGNCVYLRNDSFVVGSGSPSAPQFSTRIQELDAHVSCQRGHMLPVWRTRSLNVPDAGAPEFCHFGSCQKYTGTALCYWIEFDDPDEFPTVVNVNPYSEYLDSNTGDSVLFSWYGFCMGIQPASHIFDSRVLTDPPLCTRKIFSESPTILPNGWSARFD